MAATATAGKASLCGACRSIEQQRALLYVQRQSWIGAGSRIVVTAGKSDVSSSGSEAGKDEPEKPEKKQQSLLSSITDALDFSQARSEKDADLIEDARDATRSGEKMTPEQYAALRRKIGGTYRDFFKDSVDVKGAYVESGWIDKRCKICGKDTATSPRSKDDFGRYAHVECLESKAKSGNFFSRLFGR